MKAILEAHDLLKILKYRHPFLMIDKILHYERNQELRAIKAVSMGENYFAGHFPDFPIMPGVLITESLAQASSLFLALDDLGWENGQPIPQQEQPKIGVLGNTNISFLRSVLPGSILELEVKLDWRKGSACSIHVKALVEGEVCAKGKVTVMSIDKNKLK